MDDANRVDILIVGAGLAGLSAGLRIGQYLKRNKITKSLLVIDKSHGPGANNLSGAVIKTGILDSLVPGWRDSDHPFVAKLKNNVVRRDRLFFLVPKIGIGVPTAILPPNLKHHGQSIVSVSELCSWLEDECAAVGVDICHGISAVKPIIENGRMKGVVTPEQGIARDGNKKENYRPGETILSDVTLVADGSRGSISSQVIDYFRLGRYALPQVYSIGIKQVIKLPAKKKSNKNLVIHSLGYPIPLDVFGGGFFYGLDEEHCAVGLIIGLGWKYKDYNPVGELEIFKKHPLIARYIEGGEVIASGVRTTPEGGFASLCEPGAPGALLLGDSAGFVNLAEFKGVHLAIASGIAAADAVCNSLTNPVEEDIVKDYNRHLRKAGVIRELRRSMNFRQIFSSPVGFILGAPLSLVQEAFPFMLPFKPDNSATKRISVKRKYDGGMNKDTFVFFSGSKHDEDSLSHISIKDREVCIRCGREFGCPCISFCPGGVYTRNDGSPCYISIQHVNCMHDKTCIIKCPFENIEWQEPVGGYGPRYKIM